MKMWNFSLELKWLNSHFLSSQRRRKASQFPPYRCQIANLVYRFRELLMVIGEWEFYGTVFILPSDMNIQFCGRIFSLSIFIIIVFHFFIDFFFMWILEFSEFLFVYFSFSKIFQFSHTFAQALWWPWNSLKIWLPCAVLHRVQRKLVRS